MILLLLSLLISGVVAEPCDGYVANDTAHDFSPKNAREALTIAADAAAGGALDGTDGAVTGAIGAMMATTLADIGFDEKKEALALVSENPDASVEELKSLFLERFKEYAKYVKMATAIGALCTGRDVDLSSQMATNALDNNCMVYITITVEGLILAARAAAYAAKVARTLAPMVQLVATLEDAQRKRQERTGEDAEDILLEEADEAIEAANRAFANKAEVDRVVDQAQPTTDVVLNEKAGSKPKTNTPVANSNVNNTPNNGNPEDPENQKPKDGSYQKTNLKKGDFVDLNRFTIRNR